ncbi:hypothetical protein D3C85_925470 [compost metagenome]
MQLQHQVEERLTGRLAQQLSGVGVEVANGATAFTGRRLEEDTGGMAGVDFHPEADDLLAFSGFYLAHQLGRRQHAAVAHVDLQGLGVEQAEDFLLEAVGGSSNAHQGQHQPGTDTEQPVQLEQGLLQHVISLGRTPGGAANRTCGRPHA